MESSHRWIALGYSIPINPSRNRVYVWRKLKEFGAEYFRQGVAVLPNNKKNIARFTRLAQTISEMDGDAQLVELRFLSAADETALIQKFRRQSDSEYMELLRECADLFSGLKAHAGQKLGEYETDQLKRVVKKYTQAKSRDHFHSGASGELEEKIYGAIDTLRTGASDLASQLSKLLSKA